MKFVPCQFPQVNVLQLNGDIECGDGSCDDDLFCAGFKESDILSSVCEDNNFAMGR